MKYLFLLLTITCTSNTINDSKLLLIADHLEDCAGVSPQKCMLIKGSNADDWTYFYDQIEGFDYEEGYNYEIVVRKIAVKNPPADAASYKYVLKEILSKIASNEADPLLGNWKVITLDGLEKVSINPTIKFDKTETKVSGFAGCNNYFSSYKIKNHELTFGPAGATKKMCADMTVEDHFFKLLPQIARYEVIKSELYLYDANDRLLILAISI